MQMIIIRIWTPSQVRGCPTSVGLVKCFLQKNALDKQGHLMVGPEPNRKAYLGFSALCATDGLGLGYCMESVFS
jgi:hypothetical protein